MAVNIFKRSSVQSNPAVVIVLLRDYPLPTYHYPLSQSLLLYSDNNDGDLAFRVWQSPNPAANETPLLIAGQTVTNGIGGVSWNTGLTAHVYLQAVEPGTATLVYSFYGTGEAEGIVSRASMKLTAVNIGIVPDYNRDRVIDSSDESQSVTNRILSWWINDDADNGDISEGNNDIPDQSGGLLGSANYRDSKVNGRCDLLDFFPVWLNLGDILDHLPSSESISLCLRQADAAVNAVYTDLCATNAGSFLIEDITTCGSSFDYNAHEAPTFQITADGVELEEDFVAKIRADHQKGVLLIEGRAITQEPLVLELLRDDIPFAKVELPLSISPVEDMFRWINLRPGAESYYPSRLGEPSNRLDSETIDKTVFLAHGFLVPRDEARGWASECFKRLYQSGMAAKFCGVTWRSDQGTSADYYLNVQNARDAAAQLAPIVNAMPGGKVWMAHSLGNMLSAYAIADNEMAVDKYFALNAAVASEAYDVATVDESDSPQNYMQHENWLGYSNRTWSATWHKLFQADDDRSKLTWQNRFTNVLERTELYNFWSSGDEVLEIASGSTPYVADVLLGTLDIFNILGIDTRRYTWQKQELYKGRNLIYGTGWAGWGFAYPLIQTAEGANLSTDETLRQYPIFEHDPSYMFTNVILQANIDNILIKGIPALSPPVGFTNLTTITLAQNIDMNKNTAAPDGIERPNDWPDDSDYGYEDRWLHSQFIYVAHHFAHKLYEKFIVIGGLK
jgi:hypothetical protein